MQYFTNEILVNQDKTVSTSVSIPSHSKKQYKKGDVVTLYDEVFALAEGFYTRPAECIVNSNNRDRYSVVITNKTLSKGGIHSTRVRVDYTVHEENKLPKFTGDNAVINLFPAKGYVLSTRIISFTVDSTHVTSTGERREVVIKGSVGARFEIVVTNESGSVIAQKIKELTIKASKRTKDNDRGRLGLAKTQHGTLKTSIRIPESTSSTSYTVNIIPSENTSMSSNITDSYTINQYAPAGINISISSTTSTSLVVTGTTPVALNGIEVNSVPTSSLTAGWVITKGSGVKIYAHRQPVLSRTIAYNTSGSSDYTNTLSSANGNTRLSLQPTITQTNGTTVTMSLTHTILIAGTASVAPVLNLDNFISVKPPAHDSIVNATVGEGNTRGIKLASENNIIPVSSLFMAGGWSTVVGPVLGSLSAYGAYNSPSPGFVTFTSPSDEDWEVAGAPSEVSFTYKVNDGTTDSDTKTVRITLTT